MVTKSGEKSLTDSPCPLGLASDALRVSAIFFLLVFGLSLIGPSLSSSWAWADRSSSLAFHYCLKVKRNHLKNPDQGIVRISQFSFICQRRAPAKISHHSEIRPRPAKFNPFVISPYLISNEKANVQSRTLFMVYAVLFLVSFRNILSSRREPLCSFH